MPSKKKSPDLFGLNTYMFFIPLEEDGTGVIHSPARFDKWETETMQIFGGLSRLPGNTIGWWYDSANESFTKDLSRTYELAIASEREDALVNHLRTTSALFKQKCIFIERRGSAGLVFANESAFSPSGLTSSVSEPRSVYNAKGKNASSPEAMPSEIVGFLKNLRTMIEQGEPYFEVLNFALGVGSPLLHGETIASVTTQKGAAYRHARSLVTDYGIKNGFLLEPSDEEEEKHELRACESSATYEVSRKQYVSQLRAARILGWSLADVQIAIKKGKLVSRKIGNVLVVERESLV